MNTHYIEEETGHENCQHSGNEIKRDGFTIETFIEETAQWEPYGAFIKGVGTRYGKSTELAIESVLALAFEKTGDKFEAYYLDWVNDFLTIEGYANYYAIEESEAKSRIDIGRKIHNQKHA